MFRRKLKALDYPSADNVNITDPKDLKILVVWLENQRICHYKIEDRADLQNHEGEEWKRSFQRYLKDLECPFNFDVQLHSVVDWLLGVAVRYDYVDAAKEHPELRCGLDSTHGVPLSLSQTGKSALDIDPTDTTLAAGVRALAKIMQVAHHPDPSVLLEAVRIVIQENLTASALEEAAKANAGDGGKKKEKKQFNVTAKECGFELGDPALSEAAKVLRLLHIQELRDLQTRINEVIVAVQAITADPKTDQSLGRVGK
jgi:RLL motif-containing protein 1